MRARTDEGSPERGRAYLVPPTLIVLVALAVAGCSERGQQPEFGEVIPPSDSVVSLASAFGSAVVRREIGVLDLGTPEARSHLEEGWLWDEQSRLGWNGVWATGSRSTVRFSVGETRDIELKLRCWALNASGLGPQVMTVSVNDVVVGTLEIRSNRGGTYRLIVPARVLTGGDNQLTFEYAWSARPVDVIPDSTDHRALSVMFDEIVFDGLVDAENPEVVVSDGGRRLRIPARASVAFHFTAPANASLWIGRIAGRRLHGCETEVAIQPESRGQAMYILDPDGGDAEPSVFDLGSKPGERAVVRFTVRAPEGSSQCRGTVDLWEPHVVGSVEDAIELEDVPPPDSPSWVEQSGRPNILVYLIDCLRADHLGTYGYPRPVSPNIDRFASDAVVFEGAVAASSWTRPAVASLLTGLPPRMHGTRGDREALSETVPLLQESLRAAGYETAAVVTNGVVSSKFGFDRGFDHFRFLPEQHKKNPEIHQLSDRINVELFDWLGSRDDSRPFFVYVHSTDPHAPYLPRSPFKERFADGVDPAIGLHPAVEDLTQGRTVSTPEIRRGLIDLFDGEIAFNDDQFGRLLRWLEAEGVYDETLIVLTADHGEEFGDHGRWQHGFTLYQEQLHIPLIIKLPGSASGGGRRKQVVSQIDIAPTLLEAAAANVPQSMVGRSLRPWAAQDRTPPLERPVFADLYRDPQWRCLESVIDGADKLIWNRTYDRARPMWELYDLERDPDEAIDRAPKNPVVVGYLAMLLRVASAVEASSVPQAELSAEDEEKLRALGYLQ